jgi:hypothetical protein
VPFNVLLSTFPRKLEDNSLINVATPCGIKRYEVKLNLPPMAKK